MILSIFSFISWYLDDPEYLDTRCGGTLFKKSKSLLVAFVGRSMWVSVNTLVVEP